MQPGYERRRDVYNLYHLLNHLNMFGRMYLSEMCVLLSKLKSTQHIEVKIELDEMDLTKAESKATYSEIKEYVLEKHGLKVSQ